MVLHILVDSGTMGFECMIKRLHPTRLPLLESPIQAIAQIAYE